MFSKVWRSVTSLLGNSSTATASTTHGKSEPVTEILPAVPIIEVEDSNEGFVSAQMDIPVKEKPGTRYEFDPTTAFSIRTRSQTKLKEISKIGAKRKAVATDPNQDGNDRPEPSKRRDIRSFTDYWQGEPTVRIIKTVAF
ncbi:hypothetical protein BJV82DRAFT_629811 [Fennellomyces sp. T-0311]|nr:hypothetical protein BJV82DRAFT_629811 [Fennellomyces sp. T-0311]